MSRQCLTLKLDGITADDYIAWISDPEPAALGRDLAAVRLRTLEADTVEAALTWTAAAPPPHDAATAAGLPLTAEVAAVDACRPLALVA